MGIQSASSSRIQSRGVRTAWDGFTSSASYSWPVASVGGFASAGVGSHHMPLPAGAGGPVVQSRSRMFKHVNFMQQHVDMDDHLLSLAV